MSSPTPPPPPAGGPPPGWYDDPWGSPAKRWWDGSQWTGHVQAGGPTVGFGPGLDQRLEDERRSARWARRAMLWAGPAQALAIVLNAFLFRDFADDFRKALDTNNSDAIDTIGSPGLSALSQLVGLAVLAAGIIFLIWFYRSLTLAREAGLPARRSPGLAVAGFIIPIVNLWWPYQSTIDALPAGHPAQPLVLRWWWMWIGTSISSVATVIVAFFSTAAMWIVAAAGVGLALSAAFAARDVIAEVFDAHAELISS